jgi:hypothetical protein
VPVFGFSYSFRDARLPSIVAALVCVAGCSVIPEYPPNLPELTQADTTVGACPDIAGRFADAGQGFSPEGKARGEASLTQLLQARDPEGRTPPLPDLVVVTGPAKGILELQFFQGDQLLATLRRLESPAAAVGSVYPATYAGNRGFVLLGLESSLTGAAGIGGFVSDESLWLRKAVDGSLIVLHRTMGAGVVVIVPVWGRTNVWYRFPSIIAP